MWQELSQDWLLAAVRFAGVAVGVLGAFLASPAATREAWSTVRTYVLRQRDRVLRWLRLGKSVTVQPATVSATAAGQMAWVGTASGETWSDDPAEQIQILRERTRNLQTAITELRTDQEQARRELEAQIDALRREHRTAVSRLQAQQEAKERASVRFNARALPLIGASIVLSGLPDPVVSNPWFAWPLLVAAAVTTLAVVRRPADPALAA